MNSSKSTISVDKLSQGKRIRKSADSVAESSINSKLVNEVIILKQSMINSMEYKSKIETAVGGLEQIDTVLGKMQRLAYQASSLIGTKEDKDKLSVEFEELKNHIDFVVEETKYNDDYLLSSFETTQKATTLWENKFRLKRGADLDTAYYSTKNGLEQLGIGADEKSRYRKLINLKTGEYEVAKRESGVFKFPGMKIEYDWDPNTNVDFISNNYFSGNDTDIYITDMTDVSYMSDNFKPWHVVHFKIEGKNKDEARFVVIEAKLENGTGTRPIDKLTTTPQYLYSEYFNFRNQKPLQSVKEITLKNDSNTRFKFIKIKLPEVIKNFTRIDSGQGKVTAENLDHSGRYKGDGSTLYSLCLYGFVIPRKDYDPKEYGISYADNSKFNEKFEIHSSTAIDIGLREENINLDNEENVKLSIEKIKKAKDIIGESISKLSASLNRVDFMMNNIDTMRVNTESAISAITDLDVSDELTKLSFLEMQQVSATDMIAHDIKSKYKLLKI